MQGDFTLKQHKIRKGNLYLTLIYPALFEDVQCRSGVKHI